MSKLRKKKRLKKKKEKHSGNIQVRAEWLFDAPVCVDDPLRVTWLLSDEGVIRVLGVK